MRVEIPVIIIIIIIIITTEKTRTIGLPDAEESMMTC